MKLLLPILAIFVFLGTGCLGMPRGVKPVRGFDAKRYLGTWYEIARLDHSFERGLSRVTATYSERSDKGITVKNRGWSQSRKRWKHATGRAYFVNSSSEGYLKVTFFWPFYGSYVIFDLDPEYRYAFVSGDNTSYLWLLSRTPTVPPEITAKFLKRAEALGFKTKNLIFVPQK
ncbi:lipocalin family protein [Myxococcota bacterium]|nr:lipocalin family protein [Myxococcota bacterium]MBU1535945.1 lipocalin family protein [Myxococcota bacterium]